MNVFVEVSVAVIIDDERYLIDVAGTRLDVFEEFLTTSRNHRKEKFRITSRTKIVITPLPLCLSANEDHL